MTDNGEKIQHVRVRIPGQLDKTIVAIRAHDGLDFDQACIKVAILADANSKPFAEEVEKRAKELGKSSFMTQLNTSRATIQKNEADAVRSKEDNFHVPCSKCSKPMSFSSRDKNWNDCKVVLYAAFKTWAHVNCPK